MKLSNFPSRKPCGCLSVRGVAHEGGNDNLWQTVSFKGIQFNETNQSAGDALSVGLKQIRSAILCGTYLWTMWPSHQVHNGCKTSSWTEGIRPINNVVDTWTTPILFYFGQPMHAFDLDTFEGLTSMCVKRVLVVALDGKSVNLQKLT